MRIGEQIVLSLCKKGTYARKLTGIKVNDVQVAKACLGEDNAGNYKHATGDKRTNRIGEDVLKHNSSVVCTKSSRNENVFLVLESVELHTGSSCHARPSR